MKEISSTNPLVGFLLLSRCFLLTTTSAYGSPAKTTWSVCRCWSSTAPLPSSPPTRFCFGPSTPSTACAAAVRSASPGTTARPRSTSATQDPARTTGDAAAEREGTPASAWKTSRVSRVKSLLFVFLRKLGEINQLSIQYPAQTHSETNLLFAVYSSCTNTGRMRFQNKLF